MSLRSPFKVEPPPPARPVPRAAVRLRGALSCTASGYVADTFGTCFERTFNVTSHDLVGPRAHPAWRIQIQGPDTGGRKGPPQNVVFTGQGSPLAGEFTYGASHEDASWKATWSEDLKSLDIRATLSGGTTYAPLDLHVRVAWPAPRPPTRVPQTIVDLVQEHAGVVARPFSTYDFGRAQDPECASAILPGPAGDALVALHRGLPTGWVPFLGTTRWLDDPELEGRELVAAPGHGWADMLRSARLDPVNHGLGTEAVVRWLAEYDAAFGVQIVQVSTESLDFILNENPEDPTWVAADMLQLCPNLRDMGAFDELVERVAEGRISLWWD